MKKKKKGPLILVLVVSFVGAYLFHSYLKRTREETEALKGKINDQLKVPQPTQKVSGIEVYVAKIPIPVNIFVEERMLELKAYPENLLPPEQFFKHENLQEIVGKVAKFNIFPGEILVKQKLSLPIDASNLSQNIPEGYRALTIEVDRVKSVAGFVRQDDYVDVVASTRIVGKLVTKTVLQNVKVLAIDHSFASELPIIVDEKNQTRQIAVGKVPQLITLAVPLWAVEKIMAIEKSGGKEGLRLVLKAQKDSPRKSEEGEALLGTLIPTEGVNESDLFSGSSRENSLPELKANLDKIKGVSTVEKAIVKIHKNNLTQTVEIID